MAESPLLVEKKRDALRQGLLGLGEQVEGRCVNRWTPCVDTTSIWLGGSWMVIKRSTSGVVSWNRKHCSY